MSAAKFDAVTPPVSHEVSADAPILSDDAQALLLMFQQLGESGICPAETKLHSHGQPVSEVFLIEAGLVKFSRNDGNGCEVIITQRSAGTLLGAAAVMHRKVAAITAVTLTECRMHRCAAPVFSQQMETDREFSLCVTRTISRQYYELLEHLALIAKTPVRARLAQYLLELSQTTAPLPDGTLRMQLPFNQVFLAGWLAVSEEYLSRTFSALAKAGVIRLDKS